MNCINDNTVLSDPATTQANVGAYKALHRLQYTKLVWEIANQIGIDEALFISVIEDWCQYNAIHQKREFLYNGEWWTAATYDSWATKYPALGNARKMQRLILALEKSGYIISDQCLKSRWKRVKFYRPNPDKLGALLLNAIAQQELEEINHQDMQDLSDCDKNPKKGTKNGVIDDIKNGTTDDTKNDTFIYIDQIKDDQINFLSDQATKKKLNDEIKLIPDPETKQVEAVIPEVLDPVNSVANVYCDNDLFGNTDKKYSEKNICSETCDNKNTETFSEFSNQRNGLASNNLSERVEELLMLLHDGKVAKLPLPDLRFLANHRIKSYVAEYRKSGQVVSSNPNDLDKGFVDYVKSQMNGKAKKTRAGAIAWIKNCERDVFRWDELIALVDGWLPKRIPAMDDNFDGAENPNSIDEFILLGFAYEEELKRQGKWLAK